MCVFCAHLRLSLGLLLVRPGVSTHSKNIHQMVSKGNTVSLVCKGHLASVPMEIMSQVIQSAVNRFPHAFTAMSHTLCAYSVQHSHTVAIHEICSLLLLARCKILFQLRYVWGLTLIRQVYTQEKLMNCSWLTGFRSQAQSRHHCRRRGRDVDCLYPAGVCLDGASGGYKCWAGQ